MSTQSDNTSASATECWCCGGEYAEAELTRLGTHPEVGVCRTCAQSLHRRAVERYDQNHPTVGARLRAIVGTVRSVVIRKGWHERRIIGGALHWIDRHLP
ncbi:hypothetical protein ACFFQW_17820 [Umezawaea endophytica]|uniref:Uncharacterized protein n=1 Tax=Umezawaea endophytica TaxID=1654476 RepID=A0A9X3A4H5_9PSEU|nr:hypothetical protein [Umezawaea endophytica]MCS7482849.1 hypothetical protein [Umezawaea endophytica]